MNISPFGSLVNCSRRMTSIATPSTRSYTLSSGRTKTAGGLSILEVPVLQQPVSRYTGVTSRQYVDGLSPKHSQKVHRDLGQPGWSYGVRILCELSTSASFIWKFWIETILIILLRGLHLGARHTWQNPHVATLAASLVPIRLCLLYTMLLFLAL